MKGVSHQFPRVISVTSGKGGVGKTVFSLNLGVALSRLGKKVIVMDADWELPNFDVVLGVNPKYNITHVIHGARSLEEVLVQGPEGMLFLPGGEAFLEMLSLSESKKQKLIEAFRVLDEQADFVLVDTAAGITSLVTSFVFACKEVLLLTTPDPTAMSDAYTMLKKIARNAAKTRLSLVINMAASEEEAKQVQEKFSQTAQGFLDFNFAQMYSILADPAVTQSVRQQRLLLGSDKAESVAGRSIEEIAKDIIRKDPTKRAATQLLDVGESLAHYMDTVLRNMKSG